MALSGLALCGFVLAHLAGNLQIFAGPDALNSYAAKLQGLGPFLWVARAVLLACLAAHVVTAAQLTIENRRARPHGYLKEATVQASYASRTMPMTGLIVLAFIGYHLAHFTFRATHPEYSHLTDAKGHHDVYSMVVLSFRQWPVALSYVLAMIPLSMHLGHGFASLFQSLGLRHERYSGSVRLGARVFAAFVLIGNSSIPLAVLAGVVRPIAGAVS